MNYSRITLLVIVILLLYLCSCCDHPLSKLLGECQFSITQFLQPLVKKIESAGRLPFCTISKDPTGTKIKNIIIIIIVYYHIIVILQPCGTIIRTPYSGMVTMV